MDRIGCCESFGHAMAHGRAAIHESAGGVDAGGVAGNRCTDAVLDLKFHRLDDESHGQHRFRVQLRMTDAHSAQLTFLISLMAMRKNGERNMGAA